MMYLSKGMLCKGSNKKTIYVSHFGLPVQLTGAEADAWLNGRLGFAIAETLSEKKVVQDLVKRSLAICDPEHDTITQFWILTHCVILPIKRWLRFLPLRDPEKVVLTWIRKAGCNLSIAELVFLLDNKIKPSQELLYSKNKLALRRKIYPHCVLIANQFESRMQHAWRRAETVNAVMSLLHKKYLIIN